MITKKVFNPLAIARYMKTELVVSVLLSAGVYLLYYTGQIEKASLPFSVAVILGSALAIFLAFRNNNAYSRWWEARTLWGGITNNYGEALRITAAFLPGRSLPMQIMQCTLEKHRQNS